jgi:protein gp37
MSAITRISWSDSTFNPWIGCTKISPGCRGCYAEVSTPARTLKLKWGDDAPRHRTGRANWRLPLKWNDMPFFECEFCGWRGEAFSCPSICSLMPTLVRRRVFSASLSDWLDNKVPIEWLVDFLDLVRRTPNLDWLLLTKRIGAWRKRLEAAHNCGHCSVALMDWIFDWLRGTPPANVWIGATMVDKYELYRDFDKLMRVPARIHFASFGPMLERIDASVALDIYSFDGITYAPRHPGGQGAPGLDWAVIEGESDQPLHETREFELSAAIDLVQQCTAAGVKVHVKQLGSKPVLGGKPYPISDRAGHIVSEWPEQLRVQQFPEVAHG